MVQFKKYVFLIFMLSYNHIAESISLKKILLSVFYESNCPDSKTFILHQLKPAMRLLHDYVDLQFVPFGKSKSINYGDEGFQCQHGSSECLGNMVQDCALFHMKQAGDEDRLDYVACEMATEAGSRGDLQCVRQAKLSEKQIEECVLKDRGTILQLESEYFTSLVSPSFVPTVTYNGISFFAKNMSMVSIDWKTKCKRKNSHGFIVYTEFQSYSIEIGLRYLSYIPYAVEMPAEAATSQWLKIFDQELQDNSQVDLFGTVCSLLPDVPPCARHYNYMALGHIMQTPANPANMLWNKTFGY